MTQMDALTHEFVHFIPEDLAEGTLYVSIPFVTAIHLCCCGCGNEVVTPLDPDGWRLTFDGKSVSLHPSIGNWSLACRSHYWITRNNVHWVPGWVERERRKCGDLGQFQNKRQPPNARKIPLGHLRAWPSFVQKNSAWRFLCNILKRPKS